MLRPRIFTAVCIGALLGTILVVVAILAIIV